MSRNPAIFRLSAAAFSLVSWTAAHAAVIPGPSAELRAEVRAVPVQSVDQSKIVAALAKAPQLFDGTAAAGSLRVMTASFAGAEGRMPASKGSSGRFVVYAEARKKTLLVTGNLDEPATLQARQIPHLPAPERLEWAKARAVIEKDPVLGPQVQSGALQVLPAMPGILAEDPKAGILGRTLAVMLRPSGRKIADYRKNYKSMKSSGDEIVGVDLLQSKVLRFPTRRPAHAAVDGEHCGHEDAGQYFRESSPGTAEIKVFRGKTLVWQFNVSRAINSSGGSGSAVELTDVQYLGLPLLKRAHAPLLNVEYLKDKDGMIPCGPYRDWSNEENPFFAQEPLEELAPGIYRTAKATTINESASDEGNIVGVAVFWLNKTTLVVRSELAAGWYRYTSEWQFTTDGILRPVFSFGATENACVCSAHNHHVYWRFEWAGRARASKLYPSLGAPVEVGVVKKEAAWNRPVSKTAFYSLGVTVMPETKARPRLAAVFISPPGDGSASKDLYARGDIWVLASKEDEIDDYGVSDPNPEEYDWTKVRLGAFVTGEPTVDVPLTTWYGGHFKHRQGAEVRHVPHRVGPTIRVLKN